MSDKPETDAVKILHDRFIKGDPERLARLEIEREIADAQQETYDEYVPPLEKQVAELKAKLAEAEEKIGNRELCDRGHLVEMRSPCAVCGAPQCCPICCRETTLEGLLSATKRKHEEAQASCAALREGLGKTGACALAFTHEMPCPHLEPAREVLAANPAGAEHLEVVRAAEELEAFVSKKTPPPRKAEDVEMDYPTEFARLLSVLYEKVRALPGRR